MTVAGCDALGVERLLSPDADAAAHLDACGSCRRLGDEYRWIVGAIADLPSRADRDRCARVVHRVFNTNTPNTSMLTVDLKRSTSLRTQAHWNLWALIGKGGRAQVLLRRRAWPEGAAAGLETRLAVLFLDGTEEAAFLASPKTLVVLRQGLERIFGSRLEWIDQLGLEPLVSGT